MGPVSKIAGRYLFARKSNDVITWISRISVLGIAIGTVALIAVMSVFNGFTSLIEANLDANSPDYRIVSETSKTFALDEQQADALSKMAGLSEMQAVIEDMVALKYGDVQGVVKIKALQGVVPANQYAYWYYHDDYVPNKDYVPIFLDDNPLNTSKDNIVLISTRELKNLAHFNINNFVSGDADLQSDAINLTKLHIKLKDITKEVKNNEK